MPITTDTSAVTQRSGARVHVQKFGTFLSNMVMPNIAAFIAWGFITAIFIPAGWATLIGVKVFGHVGSYGFVEKFGGWTTDLAACAPADVSTVYDKLQYCGTDTGIVGPMITFLLPILIGYMGGYNIYKTRGGVVGAIATVGAVTGASVPMFLGAMVMGPLGGWSMKKLDALWTHKIRPGFEMLVNNFSAGIWGMLLAIVGYVAAGPFVEAFSKLAEKVVNFLVDNSLLPLTSLFVEPAKILFLNNAINHGVFTPLGTSEALEKGKSILFLIEANPGPGLGLLLAFTFFGKGLAKASAPGAAVIHFLGGIHEIYFPYVLMKPKLILAVVAGGMTGVATNMIFGSGLRAPAAPGSIIAVWLQSPPSSLLGVTLSVVLSATATFLVAALLLKTDKTDSEGDLAAATAEMESMKGKKSSVAGALVSADAGSGPIKNIVFACDAGMGSSAMGASVLRKKIHGAGFDDVSVTNASIANLTDIYDLVVTHQDLTDRARQKTGSAHHVSVDNFMASPRYDEIVELLQQTNVPAAVGAGVASGAAAGGAHAAEPAGGADILSDSAIVLTGTARTRDDAITEAGRLLVSSGAVEASYVDAMHEREKSVSTHMGNLLAIPHGTNEAKSAIKHSAISFVRYANPIDWNGKEAEFVIGIAGAGNDHLQILQKVAGVFTDSEQVARLRAATTPSEVREILGA